MKIYTRCGDRGKTTLVGGESVLKSDLRVEAYGSVDELMAFVALLADKMAQEELLREECALLKRINCRLMTVSALLAVGKGGEEKVTPLDKDAVSELEEAIDRMSEELPAITKFTIPGGHLLLSLCHVCRTVCRRAERAALRASEHHAVDGAALAYLNRLSDLLYTLGRLVTQRLSVEEILWIP